MNYSNNYGCYILSDIFIHTIIPKIMFFSIELKDQKIRPLPFCKLVKVGLETSSGHPSGY